MLSAGIPMVQAFEIIGVGHDTAVQKLVLRSRRTSRPQFLSPVAGQAPAPFRRLVVNLVEAGEQAGALEAVARQIATYRKRPTLKKRSRRPCFYPRPYSPCVIVTVILLLFVIPQFEDLFKGFGADLPAHKWFVITCRAGCRHTAFPLLVPCSRSAVSRSRILQRSRKMRQFIDRMSRSAHHRPDPCARPRLLASHAPSRRCSPRAFRWSKP